MLTNKTTAVGKIVSDAAARPHGGGEEGLAHDGARALGLGVRDHRGGGRQRRHHRAIASNPRVCSGFVQSLSLRVAFSPKEISGTLALAAGVSLQPML